MMAVDATRPYSTLCAPPSSPVGVTERAGR
jgi:hypothetical protein